MRLPILPGSLHLLLSSLLWPEPHRQSTSSLLSPTVADIQPPSDATPAALTFHLRHLHAITDSGRNVFTDVALEHRAADDLGVEEPQTRFRGSRKEDWRLVANGHQNTEFGFTIPTTRLNTHKPSSFTAFQATRALIANGTRRPDHWARHHVDSNAQADKDADFSRFGWELDEIDAPRVEKRQTLVQLAKMTFDSFYEGSEGHQDWYELDEFWKKNLPFGWSPERGLRGQIFVASDNSTVVIAFKGTSAPWIVGGEGGPTQVEDKLNNNLLFSCCCARIGPTWSPVCGCWKGDNKCDNECLERALVEEKLFYPIGMRLYNKVSYMYPDANIWLTGHSLGGSLASLLGVTFGAPTVTFEAPGDKLAARRLHLPTPPSTQHIIQVYHTGDPVPVGACTGVFSLCAIGGYAIETKCHLGEVIKYDTVQRKGWSVSIRNHPIQILIDSVLNEEWDPTGEREVPVPEAEQDCLECNEWVFEGA
ncbi:alpha/beta-hydrolase [Pluteus cervinus]|uniref:Alpha/beta-hydrolase n=1 Tax=Pluteus cervinus TaxID=181527 RepID=A0ACD3ACR7_9AGAR|nr:alpha/beta-hydrolase [Pluteus cervinus]